MQGNQRDLGLVRAVGTLALAASIIGTIVGAGIFLVPAELAACIGRYAPLAFLACGCIVGAVAICFAEGGSRYPTSGGVYGLIEAAFGPLAGYLGGTLLWVSDVLACGGIAAALSNLVASFAPPSLGSSIRATVIVGVVGGIAFVNIGGVARGARLAATATALKLLPLAVFVIAGLGDLHGSNFASSAQGGGHDLGRALIVAVFAFVGMEAPLCASGEVKDPNRTIPRALAIAMIFTILLYVTIQLIAQGLLGPALASSKAPLADAMAQIHPALRALVLAGYVLSMLGWIGSDVLGTSRLLFAFAQDGRLPRIMGRLHPRTHAPYAAILSYAAIAILLALSGGFAELAVLSVLAIAPLYIGGCAAAWVLARRGVALAGKPLGFRYLGAAAVIGILGMAAIIALGQRNEILGLLALSVLAVLVYFVQNRVALARP